MVTTAASTSKVPQPDPNRVIVVVTGANAGIGLGLCHRLLTCLSLPPDQPITEAEPQRSALSPLLDKQFDSLPSSLTPRKPFTLTLILACRSLKKAQAAKEELLKRHLELLAKRRREGVEVSDAWMDGLKIEVELLDVGSPNGENGVLDFCQRLMTKYPHITSLYSNAGIHAGIKQHWGAMVASICRNGPPLALSNDKAFMEEEVGRLSRDKQRGAVWGVNTFATYLLANELLPLLRQSPRTLPFSPRVIYTTSSTAEICDWDDADLSDVQMRSYRRTYAPSKYVSDLLMNDFDRRYGSSGDEKDGRAVRAFTVEPGCTVTSAGRAHILDSPIYSLIIFANWAVFVLLRFFGSQWHPRDTEDATIGLIYAALVPDMYLPSIPTSERFKFGAHSRSMKDSTVDYKPLDGGQTVKADEILKVQLEECERLRAECRAAEGL